MLKLNLAVPEYKEIEINGEVFTVMMSYADILKMSNEYEKRHDVSKFEKDKDGNIIENSKNRRLVFSSVSEIIGRIDEILGDGATKKISKGRPVSINTAVDWLSAINTAILALETEKTNKYIADKYE